MSYRLFLDAADASGIMAGYGAVVYEQERTKLTSFARAGEMTGNNVAGMAGRCLE